MFRRLRNHYVFTNMAITTFVLVVAFSAIYMVALNSANRRPPVSISVGEFDERTTTVFEERIRDERKESLSSLLYSLLVTGAVVEVAVLLASFYLAEQAIKPVKEAYEAQKAFIANASHEIKTPLAVISANLEAADIQGNQWIDNVATKVEDLTLLNNQMLALARAEGATTTRKVSEVELSRLVDGVVGPFRPQMKQKGVSLSVDKVGEPKKVQICRQDAKQILGILVDNAIKYSDKRIWIKVGEGSITIANDGTTISKEDVKHLFERFYQVDKTKNGIGLGLAIGHQLAELNGWKLTADSNETTTSFTLRF